MDYKYYQCPQCGFVVFNESIRKNTPICPECYFKGFKGKKQIIEMKIIEEKMECIRCGLCCLSGICSYGKPNEFGICKYFIVNKDLTTTCKLIAKGKANDLLGSGCVIRRIPDIYDYYKKQYEIVKKVLRS